MTDPFGADYASHYDLIYEAKNYDAEVELIQKNLVEHSSRPVKSILDIGCGTGSHALRLAERGFEVVGVDRSPAMLDKAREKAQTGNLAVSFVEGDIRTTYLDRRFDAVVCMFAVLGYLSSNQDLSTALSLVRRHLELNGVFVFDVWFGPAVMKQAPSERFRVVNSGESELLRASSGELDIMKQLCTVAISTWEVREAKVVRHAREQHVMRYFFPQELAAMLDHADLELLKLVPFPEGAGEPDASSWNVLGVARAKPSA